MPSRVLPVPGHGGWRRVGWWLAGAAAVVLLQLANPLWLQRLDLLAYDLLAPARAAKADDPVVLAIDEASLAALGRWPWPRSRHAEMIDRLHEAGAAAIGVALLFSEPDRQDPAGDAALAAAIARDGHVVLAAAPLQPAGPQEAPVVSAHRGHVDVEVDVDGQVRRLFLKAGAGQADLPALALAVREQAAPRDGAERLPGVRAPSAPRFAPGDASVWVRDHEVLLPRLPLLTTLSFAEALRSPRALALAKGRAVFLGITAPGLGGELATPLAGRQATLPAVELHAQAYAALAQRALMQRAPASAAWLFALGVLACLAAWQRSEGRWVLSATAVLVLPLLLSALLLQFAGYWLAPATATLGLAVALATWLAGRFQGARRQLLRTRRHAHAALHAIGDAVLTVDAGQRTIRYANPAAERYALGTDATGLLGRPLGQALPLAVESLDRLQSALAACLAQDRRVEVSGHLRLEAGGDMPARLLRASVSALAGPAGAPEAAVVVLSDVTAVEAAARALDHAATHDTLTGLPNRVLLHERLGQALARAQRHGTCAAILFLDLDRFKHVNDSLGHRTGDEVLRIMARRLRQLCRATDTVARWGGDEFVVLLDGVADQAGAAAGAAKVIDALSQDIVLDESFGHQRLPSACSMGVVLMPQDGTDIDGLLAKADMAMYRAKAQPQACFEFWSDDINSRVHERLSLELEIRFGLNDRQFVLHYQPQVAFGSARLVGMEALMRWQRTPQTLLMPASFIGVAEESGLIVDLGAWAVLQAARQVALWRAQGLEPVPVSVNLSARQCLSRDIVQTVRLALSETGISPRLLRLEITETAAMSDAAQVIGLMEAIHALGVGLAVDDFGTGYSSLAYLKGFPVEELKIDRMFIENITVDKSDAAIVRATIALAHGLGLRVVAEGVETQEQSAFLAALDCDAAQGYLFGHPLPAADSAELLRLQQQLPAPKPTPAPDDGRPAED